MVRYTYIKREPGRLELALEELHVQRDETVIEESHIDKGHVLVAEHAQIAVIRLHVEHELQLGKVLFQRGADVPQQILPAELVRNAMRIDGEVEKNGLYGHGLGGVVF